MINEEEFLKTKMGTRNPFTTPEGYFDQLVSRTMSRLPKEEKRPARVWRLRPWLAAACVCGVVAGMAMLFLRHSQQETVDGQGALATMVSTDSDFDDFDEAADYAMMDNEAIYNCLLADI